MNSKNRKKYDPYRLLLDLTDKTDIRNKDKYFALSNLSIYIEKYKKTHIRIINLKYQLQHGMKI